MRAGQEQPVRALLLYCLVSPVLTWLNKYLLTNGKDTAQQDGSPQQRSLLPTGFHNVLALTVTQLLASFVVLSCVVQGKSRGCAARHTPPFQQALTVANPSSGAYRRALQLVPVAVCFVLQLTLSSAALQELSVSSYQATRSTSILFSAMINHLYLRSRVSPLAVLCCCLTCSGMLLAWFDPQLLTQSAAPIVYGAAASLMGVLYMTLYRYNARQKAFSDLDLMRWVSFDSALLLLPFFISDVSSGGARKLLRRWVVFLTRFSGDRLYLSALSFAATLLLAPLLPLCSYDCFKQFTPLGCSMVGAFKSSFQALLGNLLFGDPITVRSCLGLGLCILGCALYSLTQ